MKAKVEDMISISLSEIDPTAALPFPIFLHLPRNKKFIPLRHAGDPLGQDKYRALKSKSHFSLWTSREFRDFLRSDEAGSPPGFISDEAPVIARPEASLASGEHLKGHPSLVEDVLQDDLLSADDKAEILSEVSQDMLRVINQITARGEEAREAGFKRCKDVVDKVLEVAAQESDVYTEILKIWSSQESIMHSAGVGTLAVMFAMCLGYQDEQILADIVVAAVFHDVGKVQMADVASKPNTQRTSAENSVFESHVAKSFTMVKECGLEFHPRIYRMISEHHENYDGSGFPKGLQGNEISESSQLLRLANFFDELISGADNGKPMSPSEAFDFIYTSESEATHGLRISPELMHRLFQFMERERVASEVSLEASAQQVAKTTNKLRV